MVVSTTRTLVSRNSRDIATSETTAIEPSFCYSPASRATWQTIKLGGLGSGSNCLIYVLSCGLDARMLSGISHAITQSPPPFSNSPGDREFD